MKTSFGAKIGLAVVLLLLLWHLKVATSAQTRVAGVLLAKPAQPGYVWRDLNTADSRFFWDIADVKWKAGIPHPEFNVVSAEKQGDWHPMPGYVFVDKTVDLNTVWKEDELHPDFMAWSDKTEGAWIPVAGYRFTYTDGDITGTVWEPNKRYNDLRICTLAQQDQYKSFPGYQFTEPGKSLNVVWTPGVVNSDNARLMAGAQEGSWVVANPHSSGYRSTGYGGNTFGRRVARRMAVRASDHLVDRAFGY